MTETVPFSVLDGRDSDADKAAQVRARLGPLLEQIAAVMNQAKAEGLIVGFAVNRDSYGIARPSPIEVVRHL